MPRSFATRPAPRARADRARGGTLLGVFIGLVLGIVLAGAVTIYVTGGWKVYAQQLFGRDGQQAPREPAKSAKAGDDKPRFDFYKILPGGEEPKAPAKPSSPDRSVADKAADKAAPKAGETPAPAAGAVDAKPKAPEKVASADAAPKAPDRFWLQAGSFASEPDAENLKARLALAGWEAQVQQGQVADKGVRYRVRLGPYDNTDELNRIKGELARRGFDVAVIRY
jgi:cell division protein FtsN